MAIRIKRSSGDIAPASLASGQLAYSEGATNGGTLYYGEIGGTVRPIAGKKYVDKLDGIEAGAQVNVIEEVVDDLTPQLGGALDVNGKSIVSVSNGNITLAPNGTGKVVISGDLQIDGTTTTINSTTLDVDDLNITVAKGAANAAAANGAGLTVEGPTTPATILYASSDDSWNFNKKTTFTELQVDNININGNTISSTDTDGSITLTPNGIGDVQLLADTILVGDSGSTATITTNGAGNLLLHTNSGTNSGSIQINQGAAGNIIITPDTTGDIYLQGDTLYVGDVGSNANISSQGVTDLILGTNSLATGGAITIGSSGSSPITIQPDGNGDVNLNADTVRVGDQNSAATITTWGTGNLILNTNAGTNSGSIQINQGANGNMTIACNGLGVVAVNSPLIATITNVAATASIFARHSVSASNSVNNYSFIAQKTRSDIALASMTDEPAVVGFAVRDNVSTNRIFGRLVGRYQGTGTNPIFQLYSSVDGFTTTNHYMTIADTLGTFGNTSSDYTLSANTGGALKLTANNNTTSGVITIASGADGTISLVPNGVGKLLLDNVYWPVSDGSANQVLKTDGAGQASWVTVSSLVSDTNTTYSVSAETVTSGANLRLTGSDASTDDVAIIGGTNVTVTRTDANTITISSTDTVGISNVVEDTTPQLGGNLDVNGNSIVSVSNGDITIAPNGSGDVQLQADIFVGRTNTDVQISTNGTADLILNTNNAVNSGVIRMYDGANGNIVITPDGTGSIVLDGLNWPQTDGSADYVLKTNGSGQLSWVAQPTVISTFVGLTDTPANYTGSGGYYVKVNSGATALEFSQDVDDGTF